MRGLWASLTRAVTDLGSYRRRALTVRFVEPFEHGRQATIHIEKAVLGVLVAADREGRPIIGAAEISRRAGIENGSKAKDWITQWALARLMDAGKAMQHPNRAGWQATPEALAG